MAKIYDASKFFGQIKTSEDAQFWANHTPFFLRVMFAGMQLYIDIVEPEDFEGKSSYSYYPMQGFFEETLSKLKDSGHLTLTELDTILGQGAYSDFGQFIKSFVYDKGSELKTEWVKLKCEELQTEHGKYLERLDSLHKVNLNG